MHNNYILHSVDFFLFVLKNAYFSKLKVMKEWSELEEHYQEMRLKDPKGAEDFKKKMTGRFQKTVEALEEEGSAEKRQLISMHQQRVMTIINMRKKSAMDCFTQSLDQTPPKTKRIEKCLEKLLRSLEKDRTHTLHHFRHLLNSYTKQALKDKDAILDHLDDLIRMANQSIQMLDRVPTVADKIRKRMIAFWHNLRGIPLDDKISKESELAIMDRYEEEVAQKQQERERQKMLDEERKQELKELQEEKKRVEANQKGGKLEQEFDPESMEDERTSDRQTGSDSDEFDQSRSGGAVLPPTATTTTSTPMRSGSLIPHEDEETNEVHDILPTPKQSYIQNQAFHHNEAVRLLPLSLYQSNIYVI
jgi:amyloid beta A4 protein